MSDVGSRLRRAIETWGSIRRFADAIGAVEPRVRGSSYAMIHRYLAGSSVPPLEFLKAAATTLNVREAWLSNDDGEMTEAETQQAGLVQDRSAADYGWLDDRIAEGFPEFRSVPPLLRVHTYALVARFVSMQERALHVRSGMRTRAADVRRRSLRRGDFPESAPSGDELAFYVYLRKHLLGPLLDWRDSFVFNGLTEGIAGGGTGPLGELFDAALQADLETALSTEEGQYYLAAAHQTLYFAFGLATEDLDDVIRRLDRWLASRYGAILEHKRFIESRMREMAELEKQSRTEDVEERLARVAYEIEYHRSAIEDDGGESPVPYASFTREVAAAELANLRQARKRGYDTKNDTTTSGHPT